MGGGGQDGWAVAADVALQGAQVVVYVLSGLSVAVAGDRLYHAARYGGAKLIKRGPRAPEKRFQFTPLPDPAAAVASPKGAEGEAGAGAGGADWEEGQFPAVAVQLPMFNERAVCREIIRRTCELQWPRKKLFVQVLDDSTDPETRDAVDGAALFFRNQGVQITVLRRENRQGYKAGALKEGLEALGHCDFVAILDADFKPDRSFLRDTVPYLIDNADVGYVQTRWTFANPNETLLTKAQQISLNFHVKCEQWVEFESGHFFNFNGTAGVWRRSCIKDPKVGGWEARTTVEDMDLSLRAHLAGWKAVFLDGVTCENELPSSYFAYRKQQHRWCCGPMQLWVRSGLSIFRSQIGVLEKLYLFFVYFAVRKFATHCVTLLFFCFVVPMSMFLPVHVPFWALVYVPIAVSLSTVAFTGVGGFFHCVTYVLFENCMSLVRSWAVITGLLNLPRANEWVVTTKTGSSDQKPMTGALLAFSKIGNRIYIGELVVAAFFIAAALFGVTAINRWDFSIFLFLQGGCFLAFGLNMVDADAVLGRADSFKAFASKKAGKLRRQVSAPY